MQLKSIILALCSGCLMAAAWSDASSRLSGEQAVVPLPLITGAGPIKLDQTEREALFTKSLSPAKREIVQDVATQSLAAEPLSATALWGWSASQADDVSKTGLMVAEKVTRRELGVQMEWFRSKAEGGDLGASFKHLDRALTVYPDAAPMMLGGLAQVLKVKRVRTIVAPYSSRPWFGVLICEATSKTPNSLDIAALLTEANLKTASLQKGTLPGVLRRLVQEGEGFEAGQLALRMKALNQNGLEQFGVGEDTTQAEAKPLTWQLPTAGGVSGALGQQGQVTFIIEPGRSGTLLDRVTVYRNGSYNLTQSLSASDPRISLAWELRCLDGAVGRLVWSQSVPLQSSVRRLFAKVNIPTECPVQRWTLKGSASDLQVAGEIELDQLDLEFSDQLDN